MGVHDLPEMHLPDVVPAQFWPLLEKSLHHVHNPSVNQFRSAGLHFSQRLVKNLWHCVETQTAEECLIVSGRWGEIFHGPWEEVVIQEFQLESRH
jgi:hypothetical protein